MPALSRREALNRPAGQATARPAVAQAPTPSMTPPTHPEPSPRTARRQPRASAAGRPPRPQRGEHSWPKLDIAIAGSLGIAATAAAVSLPPSTLRTVLALPMILFVPGYLLLQAFVVPAAAGRTRTWQAFASIGISPAILGLMALSTSIVQGGFRLGAILMVTTLGCLAFATTALLRRRALAHAASTPADAPQGATAKTGPMRP
ncbi:MAG: DUF1616 domain-containing protein [Thermoplasmatota archaeon]